MGMHGVLIDKIDAIKILQRHCSINRGTALFVKTSKYRNIDATTSYNMLLNTVYIPLHKIERDKMEP